MLAKLDCDLICLVDHRPDLSRKRIDLDFVALLTVKLFLLVHEVLLLLLNNALVFLFFLFHGKSSQLKLMLSLHKLLLSHVQSALVVLLCDFQLFKLRCHLRFLTLDSVLLSLLTKLIFTFLSLILGLSLLHLFHEG